MALINQSINQPINQPINQSINQSIIKSINQSVISLLMETKLPDSIDTACVMNNIQSIEAFGP